MKSKFYVSIILYFVFCILAVVITPFAIYTNRVCNNQYYNKIITTYFCIISDPGRTIILYLSSIFIVIFINTVLISLCCLYHKCKKRHEKTKFLTLHFGKNITISNVNNGERSGECCEGSKNQDKTNVSSRYENSYNYYNSYIHDASEAVIRAELDDARSAIIQASPEDEYLIKQNFV